MKKTLKINKMSTLTWAILASAKPDAFNIVETSQQKFIRLYLRHIRVKNNHGVVIRILALNHLARENDPDVLKNHELMLYALRFDLKSAIQVVDQSLFTANFICEAYAIPSVGLEIIELLPHYVKSDPKLMIEIYQRLDLHDVIKAIPDNLRGDPTFMSELVLEDPSVYQFAHGKAQYSFTVLLAAILKGSQIDAVKIYEKSYHKEPYFQQMLKFFTESSDVYTLDSALLMSIRYSRELTLKYQFIPEYRPFYDRVRHDIAYFNQMSTIQLCVNSWSGNLRKLRQGMFTHMFMDKIFDFIDVFSYGKEVTMITLIQIARHLGIHVVLY